MMVRVHKPRCSLVSWRDAVNSPFDVGVSCVGAGRFVGVRGGAWSCCLVVIAG
jgi:hypothetical protein